MELFITILQLICGLIVIGIVLFQSGKSAGQSVVCFRSHLIGNDYDLIEFFRIILFKKALYGSNNHAVFLVGGKEHDDASERTGFGVLGSPVKLGGNSV